MKKRTTILKGLFLLFLSAFFLSGTIAKSSPELSQKLSGLILLQTEENGEAWYVNPADKNRYYLGRPASALRIMKELGAGINNQNLSSLPPGVLDSYGPDSDNDGLADDLENALGTDPDSADSDGDGYSDKTEILNNYDPAGKGKISINSELINNNLGKILLQVENKGQAWYLNPKDKKRYFLGSPAQAFIVMKNLGLGIKNRDLEYIKIGNLNEDAEKSKDKPSPDPDNSENKNNLSAQETFNRASRAIINGDTEKALNYFSSEAKRGAEYSLNFLSKEGRALLGNIMKGARLTKDRKEIKIFTKQVFFFGNGEKTKINFTLKRQNDGKWVLTDLGTPAQN